MKTRDVIVRLVEEGWAERPRKGGSHRVFVHPTKPGHVVVSDRGSNADIPLGTMNAIKKQAGWT